MLARGAQSLGGREPLSPVEHGDSPGLEMSGTTKLLGDPGVVTNNCTAPMDIGFPTVMIVPARNAPSTAAVFDEQGDVTVLVSWQQACATP